MAQLPPETRYARSGGANIAFQVLGTGPVDLVMVPGLISHLDLQWESTAYRRFTKALARNCRVIRFDKRGTGLSDPVRRLPSLLQRVEDVSAVLRAAGSRRALVFGHSEGGRVAAVFAASHPERAIGLVLFGTSYRPPRPHAMRAIRSILEHWGEGRLVDLFAPSVASPEARRLAGAFERASASPAMAAALVKSLGLTDVRRQLRDLELPTLVLHREAEFVPVWEAKAIAERIPHAKLVVLPGRDHLPWIGDWEAVVNEIVAFLADLSPQARGPKQASLRGTGRQPRRPPFGWASLTAAELKVIRLVAEGLGNPGIAERLYLSRHTVESHLKHVFAKLGVESRTELAGLARARGA